MVKVKIKRLAENAVVPTKAHPTDAGFDLTATLRFLDHDGNIVYGFGLAFEIPDGYVGLVFPRSSICKKDLALSNAVGVIDCHYRGEIFAKFKPTSNILGKTSPRMYKEGERCAQIIIIPIPQVEFEEANELSATDRGDGGYGSTGK